jgi:DNA (cytosine-5)-methyltransferase 1
VLLSLFCGAGGLDLGFEAVGFEVDLALDVNEDSVQSYNRNRPGRAVAKVADIAELDAAGLHQLTVAACRPVGIIGGPPCQSFSQANVRQQDDDPRHTLPLSFARLVVELNSLAPVDFIVLENVVGLTLSKHRETLEKTKEIFDSGGFEISQALLDAQDFGTPQTRRRLFIVGFNRRKFGPLKWTPPTSHETDRRTVRDAIGALPEPIFFARGADPAKFPWHPNHWCMKPKSRKFLQPGALQAGNVKSRSFKTLSWDRPSIAVAYGHREVHIHPNCRRRLSVYEAMQLQGFPHEFRLYGNLSSQIRQVSEAVPIPLARAVAQSVKEQLPPHAQLSGNADIYRANGVTGEPLAPAGDVVIGTGQ